MSRTKRVAALTAAGGLAITAGLFVHGPAAGAASTINLTPVPAANGRAPGLTSPSVLSRELIGLARAQGSMRVENPTDGVGYYGYDSLDNNPPLLPTLGGGSPYTEAHKTEPDKNTYLVQRGQSGPDGNYDYGTHFLYQGHESGTPGYVTRVNLDADAAHRVTVLATRDVKGAPLPDFDGSTYDPFTSQLLLTSEIGCASNGSGGGGVWAGQAAYSPTSTFAEVPALGKGGFEGIQAASDGSLWLVEDVGGSTQSGTNAKLANSYVYRFVPATPGDLTTGTLQALQVKDSTGSPLDTTSSVTAPGLSALHTYGASFATQWVPIHQTTSSNRSETFCATQAARAAHATAFKRPENGVFRPGTSFREFFFTETGDTNSGTTAGQQYGGFGGVFKLSQTSPSADTGTLTAAFVGDVAHTGLDNIAFLDGTPSSRTPATRFTSSATRSTRATCSMPRSRSRPHCASSPRDATRPPRSTRRSVPTGLRASTTTATTRSPAFTSRMGMPPSTGFSAPACRDRSRRAGACSGRSSTATTSHGRWSRPPLSTCPRVTPTTRAPAARADPGPVSSERCAAATHDCCVRREIPRMDAMSTPRMRTQAPRISTSCRLLPRSRDL
ncbi:MAG: hypothetical protein QOJ79_1213 [Actinomycetota bacterium]|jgi:hypothetical protein|nr:hypothetical protein [Actinomycetota bacterium]